MSDALDAMLATDSAELRAELRLLRQKAQLIESVLKAQGVGGSLRENIERLVAERPAETWTPQSVRAALQQQGIEGYSLDHIRVTLKRVRP